MAKTTYDICVLPGDGIGTEVTAATLPLLERLAHGAGFGFAFTEHPGGALHYKAPGDALPDATYAAAERADAILFGAMGWPDISVGGPGFCFPVQRWNGREYKLQRWEYEGKACKPPR